MPSYNTEKSVTSLLLSYNYLEVDYIKYRQSFTFNPSYTFVIRGNHLGQIFLKYRKDEFDRKWHKRKFGGYQSQQEDRDADNISGGIGYFYTFSKGQGLFNIRAETEYNNADGANWDYACIRGSTGLLYPLFDKKLRANLYLEAYQQDYQNSHTIYKLKRRDNTIISQTSLTYTILKPMDITIGYTYIKNNSNIKIYEYRRNLYTISLEYKF